MTETTDTLASSDLLDRAKTLLHGKEFERFWKFAVVGIIGAVVDFGTFTALRALGWLDGILIRFTASGKLVLTGVGLAGAIAFALAVTSNFIWNRYWTYPDSRSKPVIWQLVTFFLVNIVGILIRIPILEILSGPFAKLLHTVLPHLSTEVISWLGQNVAWALAVIVVMFWNFFVNRYWTYNDVS